MTTIKILLRPSLVSVLVATTALGGCKLSALDLTPPRVIQLSCSSTSATPQAPMVLILDSGQASVVWVNRRCPVRYSLCSPRYEHARYIV